MKKGTPIFKFDYNGREMRVGDIVREGKYRYEIRFENDEIYAHILDGSGFHLSLKELGQDFIIVKR